MKIEDFQQAWDAEGSEELVLPAKLEKLRMAHQPIDMIKKNMRQELVYQSAAIAFLGVFPLLIGFNRQFYFIYYFAYTSLLLVSAYYLVRFYKFSRVIHNYAVSSLDSLYELDYEIRINMEAYKSFSFLLVPFTIVASILFTLHLRIRVDHDEELFKPADWVSFPLTIGIIILATVWLTNWWVEHYYGKYARQIRILLDELKESA